MTVNVPIFYQCSGVTPSKVYYSNTGHHFCVNWALLSLRPILQLSKIPNIAKNWCVFSQYTPNEILLIHQTLNSSRPKVYYYDARHQFYIKSPSLALRPLWYFQENSKRGNYKSIKLKSITVIQDISSAWIQPYFL